MTRANVIVASVAVFTGGIIAVDRLSSAALLLAVVGSVTFAFRARLSALGTLLVALLLVAPGHVAVVATLSGADIRATDPLIALCVISILIRTPRSRGTIPLAAVGLVAWCLVRSSSMDDLVTVARFAEYLFSPLVLWRVWSDRPPIYRRIGAMAIAAALTAPLFSTGHARYPGLPGGPNEVGLLGGVALLVGLSGAVETRQSYRTAVIVAGAALLVESRSVTSLIATGVGLALLARSQSTRFRRSAIARPLVVALSLTLPILAPALRPDAGTTFDIHRSQAQLAVEAFQTVNPAIGGGWGTARAESGALIGSRLNGSHSTYLQFIVDLGVIGLVLFLLLIAWLVRRDQPVSAAAALVALWLATVTPTPGAPWALLGLLMMVAGFPTREASTRSSEFALSRDVRSYRSGATR